MESDLEVKMVRRGASCPTHCCKNVSLTDVLSLFYLKGEAMSVKGGDALAMVNNDDISISAEALAPLRDHFGDHPSLGGSNRSSLWHGDVDTCMKASPSPLTKGGGDPTAHGP